MEATLRPAPSRPRPRDVLIIGAFVVGWSVGRAVAHAPVVEPARRANEEPSAPRFPETLAAPAERGRPRLRKATRLAMVAVVIALVLVGAGLAIRPDEASAPLVSPAVAAREHAMAVQAAEKSRLNLLRHLELAGIAARRVGLPETAKPHRTRVVHPIVQPSERAIAVDTYVQALGASTILRGLDASRDQLQQQVLSDPRLSIYPAGRGDVASGKLDVRVLAIIEYLAQANGQVSVSCLITGHPLYVAGRPGVISAHIYGRAVDISAVANTEITGHQGPGSVTERAIKQLLALPESVEPVQVISLMALGGPSFALPDHYNHIHIGY